MSYNNGAVGDATYDTLNSGVQAGHSASDVNTIIPDVNLPSMPGALSPTSGGVSNYTYYLTGNNANYVLPTSFSTPRDNVCRRQLHGLRSQWFLSKWTGHDLHCARWQPTIIRWWIERLYISGNGIVNAAGNAANCQLWGLPSLTSLTYSGNGTFIGTVYSPEAVCTLTGNGDMSGAVVGKSVTLGGNGNFHYDEALGGPLATNTSPPPGRNCSSRKKCSKNIKLFLRCAYVGVIADL